MTRYLAIPKQDAAIAPIEPLRRGFSPGSRAEQIEALRTYRRDAADPAREIVESIGPVPSARIVASPADRTPVTGITVLEAEPGSLSELQESMPDHDVIEDFPLALDLPTRTGDVIASDEAIDTWHLDAIDVTRTRAGGFDGTGKGVGIAVLDTGIEEVDEIRGRVKSAWRLDAEQQVEEIRTTDTHGHGTHVAGLVAGRNVGVAPGADLLNFIMIPRNSGQFSDFVLAIDFSAQRADISVMCMSAGFRGWKPEMQGSIRALLSLNVLPVVAIGNEGSDTSRSPGNYTESLSVGASNVDGKIWTRSGGGMMSFEGQSYDVPDLVAPGEQVTSCLMDGGYEAWNGSSMATALVAGVAALIIERFPMIDEPSLRAEILDACVKFPSVPDVRQGNGIVRVPTSLWFDGV